MSRFQTEISTVKLVANLGDMVRLLSGWPTGFPSGGEPGARAGDGHRSAQSQLNSPYGPHSHN